MSKDQTPLRSSSRPLQFFVRILSGNTLVLNADSSDTIESLHEKIHAITGIPVTEQCLIYQGVQLGLKQTLSETGVENDANLHLVGRMRSTDHPQACQLIDDIVKFIFHLYENNHPSSHFLADYSVKSLLVDYFKITPQEDADKASGHFQIFSASSAPAALVMLYMSSYRQNRLEANGAIRHFITSCKTDLPKHIYHQCMPVFLGLCKLLKKAAGVDDRVYCLCRSGLGEMVGQIEIGEKKGLIGVLEIFAFVFELAAKLSRDLLTRAGLRRVPGPSLSDVNDFSSFLAPVSKEIKGDVGLYGPIKVPLSEDLRGLRLRCADEITRLHSVFVALLIKIDICLKQIEDDININSVSKKNVDTLCVGSDHYLALLKELHNISKLYNGCEGFFWDAMERRKVVFCHLIVKNAKRSEDHNWILECKKVTNFEARRHLAMMMLPEVKEDYGEHYEMLIDRSKLLADSFEYIIEADTESLRAGLFMEFKNEEATGPGVLWEWFFLVCQAIVNMPDDFFVACLNDPRRFFPNPALDVEPWQLEYFDFSGKVIALALMHNVQVGIAFDRAFFLQLSGHTISLEDIRDADPYLYSSCKKILEMDPEAIDQDALGLTFIHEIEELGTRKAVELCPGGRSIAVNSQNRRQYVDSLIQQRFVIAIAEPVSNFAKGFADILGCRELQRSFFQCLNLEDLNLMLYGSETEISVDDWKAHTEYHGFKETDAQISWFWKIVGDMTAEEKKDFLFFWTSIKYLPIEGFSGLSSRLHIHKTCEPSGRLPSSHTCFYQLCLPDYPTSAMMCDRLSVITQEHVGFALEHG